MGCDSVQWNRQETVEEAVFESMTEMEKSAKEKKLAERVSEKTLEKTHEEAAIDCERALHTTRDTSSPLGRANTIYDMKKPRGELSLAQRQDEKQPRLFLVAGTRATEAWAIAMDTRQRPAPFKVL